MADASKQVRPVLTVSEDDTNTTFSTDTAIAREFGGTGVSVSTMAALTAELSAMTGTDGATPGVKGLVPAPAGTGTENQSDTYRPLRGDGTFGGGANGVSSLWLTEITGEDGGVRFEILGAASAVSNLWVYGTTSPYYARVGASSTSGVDVDINIEPKGNGRPTHKGDPILQSMRAPRFITANAFDSTFSTVGLTAPTVTTPGASAVTLDDANSTYVTLANVPLTNRLCGVSVPSATKRRLTPDLVVVFRTPLLRSRIWVGLFSADPSAYTDLTAASIKGAGVYYDRNVGAPQTSGAPSNLTIVAVNGTSKTYTRTSGSFILDGFRVGQDAAWSGFANAGNNGTFTVSALSATVMTVTDAGGTMVTESAGASVLCSAPTETFWRATTCDGTTQTETVMTAVPTANAWTSIRISNLGSTWRFSVYNTTTSIWDFVTNITTTLPALSDQLGLFVTNYCIAPVTAARTDVSVDGTANTFTRAAGSWFDEGWRVGDGITTAGFGDGANNLTTNITNLTETVMSVVSTALNNESAGASVTFTSANSTISLSTASLHME